MSPITLDSVRARYAALGFEVYAGGDFDLNLFGLRMLPGTPNAFDDVGGAFYLYRGVWQFETWPITTDPGSPSLTAPTRSDGTAILLHDRQHRALWTLGEHHAGRPDAYPALVQNRDAVPPEVWRDRGTDGRPTYGGTVYRNVSGLNYHRAGEDSTRVDRWSEACWVTARRRDHDRLMVLARMQAASGHGSRFTGTCLGWTG